MKVSVIIPTFNEEKTICSTLENLLTFHKPDEIIVVDGSSADQTVSLVSEWAPVIQTSRGRAHQMNVGAGQAQGNILLFLHAGTLLPPMGIIKIKDAVHRGALAGRFRMRFDDRNWLLGFYESYTRFHFFSYGDQGFFVTKEIFEKLNGFDERAPFEDIDFYRRLRQRTKPVILGDAVITSARRFIQKGSSSKNSSIDFW